MRVFNAGTRRLTIYTDTEADLRGYGLDDELVMSVHDPETRPGDHWYIYDLYKYEHGGVELSLTPFSCRWDSGQIGYLYLSKSDFENEKDALDYVQARITEQNDIYAGNILAFVDEQINYCACCGQETQKIEIERLGGFIGEADHPALIRAIDPLFYREVLTSDFFLQTEELCLEAVQQSGYALQYVHEQTEEICIAACTQSGWALQFVDEQTPAICMAAVAEDGLVIQFVKEQTEEICLAAIAQTSNAAYWIEIANDKVYAALEGQPREYYNKAFMKEDTRELCMKFYYECNQCGLKYNESIPLKPDSMVREILACKDNGSMCGCGNEDTIVTRILVTHDNTEHSLEIDR